MIRRPPRSTLSSSSAASDVYKRQALYKIRFVVVADVLYWSIALIFFVIFRDLSLGLIGICVGALLGSLILIYRVPVSFARFSIPSIKSLIPLSIYPVSYTHLRAHETPE